MAIKIFYDDVIFSLQKSGGISTYWKNMTTNSEITNAFTVIRDGGDTRYANLVARQWQKYKRVEVPEDFDGIFHSSYYRIPKRSVRTVVTVHDFIYQFFSSGLPKKLNMNHIIRAIKDASAVICVSSATKTDLINMMPGFDESKVHVIHHGVDHELFSAGSTCSTNSRNDMALFVGARQGYKNFSTAVLSLSNLSSVRLGIVGSALTQNEVKLLKDSRVSFVEYGHVSNQELADLYRTAGCLIYPSLYEGFGIPIIEAMSSGLPVVISDNAATTEAAGGFAHGGRGQEVDSYVAAISAAFNMAAVDRAAAADYAKKFTWTAAANATINVYRSLEG